MTQLAVDLATKAAAVDLSKTPSSKWSELLDEAEVGLGLDRDRIAATGLASPQVLSKQGRNRRNQLHGASGGTGFVVLGWPIASAKAIDALVDDWREAAELEALVVFAVDPSDNQLKIGRIYVDSSSKIPWKAKLGVQPEVQTTASPAASAANTPSPSPTPTPPLAIDDRIWQLVRLAVRTGSGVLLVGPPGTGKTTLLRRILAEAATNPADWNLSGSQPQPLLVTPDESWTTQDLVGGQTLHDGGLQFRPGHLLDALSDGRWLVLDEMNRADMDRIFGPVFSWLSGEEAEIGRTGQSGSGEPVTLGWSSQPASSGDVRDLDGDQAVDFRAGTDWRLLGTYNAVDANRVFRIGQALGRRFIRVPIPPPDPPALRDFFAKRHPDADDLALDVVVALYAGHLASAFPLGPAVFVRLADMLDDRGLLAVDPRTESDSLADCYLLAAAAWLARLTPELVGQLRAAAEAHMGSDAAPDEIFDDGQWQWLQDLSRHVA